MGKQERGWKWREDGLFSGAGGALPTSFQRLLGHLLERESPRQLDPYFHRCLWKVMSDIRCWSLESLQCILLFPGSVPDMLHSQISAPQVT